MMHEVKFSMNIDGTPVDYDLTEDLYVSNELDLTRHMNEIPGHIAYWGILFVRANNSENRLKDEYKIWIAKIKSEVVNAGGKFNSETSKEEAVIVKYPDEYLKWQKLLEDSRYVQDMLGVVRQAFSAKQEMLISIGAQVRASMSSGITIKGMLSNVEVNKKEE
jgi:hypothetical protein